MDVKKIMMDAYKKSYAIPQFNIVNGVYTRYILEACEEERSPVIIGVSEKVANHIGGFTAVKYMIEGLIKNLKITVPVILHLDHSKSVEACEKAIKAGFDSVMLDYSHEDISTNIEGTRYLTKKYKYIVVESEIGRIGKNGNKGIEYTEVKDALELSKKSKCDWLAISIGTVHGPYKGTPKINYKRLKEIKEEIKKPLVMHGGSGLSDQVFKKSIKLGISKININTELKKSWAKSIREILSKDKKEYDPVIIERYTEEGLKETAKHFIKIFGSKGKA